MDAGGTPALAVDHEHGLVPAKIASRQLLRFMLRRIHLCEDRRTSPEFNCIDSGAGNEKARPPLR